MIEEQFGGRRDVPLTEYRAAAIKAVREWRAIYEAGDDQLAGVFLAEAIADLRDIEEAPEGAATAGDVPHAPHVRSRLGLRPHSERDRDLEVLIDRADPESFEIGPRRRRGGR